MAVFDRDLNVLYQIARVLERGQGSASGRVEQLYDYLFKNDGFRDQSYHLSPLSQWTDEGLERALYYSEEIISTYTHLYYDPRVIPVTYYKRERRVRRHLDEVFSGVFKELIRRRNLSLGGQTPAPELILEEPIYYLKQLAREKSFPKAKDHRASLEILKSRFHLALSHRLVS
jgi:hypothetical protein